ncbi:carboxypeptidase-like regulatory domain-containing protein [Myxococcus sp. RHSTA-1-4]|uniref:carboxypeptidase-like regulatory domain-containing protein n=1 Tax=Myxococcus sp. RHSTA-1-4 TaxID=2874601 RepID=UPI001CBCE3EF|nr:carboxypeptidase-like regulatory domain-containing protein [Myxococcus sp. RHSTA-1-4]MBZ4419921.1 carboxypeptidase regulatory-like domain-containing protein [Myxococcus sp. RHSTA-1-4]
MSPSPRPFLLAGLACALLALAGCAADSTDGARIPADPYRQLDCAVDQDCPDPALFFCDTAVSRCAPACRTPEDCLAARRAEYALAECDGSPLGCQCDMNRCMPGVCAADADCGGGRVCRDGACVVPPAAETVDACEVTPDVVVGRPGLPVVFTVWARDKAGAPVVPRDGVTWRARAPAVTGEGTGSSARFVLAEPGDEREAVEARVGSATCRARVTVLPATVPAGGVRVLVVDELTGRPVPLATVAVSNAAGALTASAVTGPEGATWVPATGEVGLSVFHADYGYLTLARQDVTGERDVRLALRRNPLDRFGGVRGTFGEDPKSDEATPALRLGLAGLSMPGLPAELAPEALLGPEREVEVALGNSRRRLSLPSGAALWLAGTPPMEVNAPGVAGFCDTSLEGVVEAELAVRAGACGTRAAWALQGGLPLRELPLNALEPGVDPLLLLGRLVPGSPRFSSTVRRDTRFTLDLTPGITSGAPDVESVRYPRAVSFAEGGVRLAFPFAVRVPELPRYRGVYLDRAYVLATVSAPGRGVVPLGLGAATNAAPADPNTDKDERLASPGLVLVRMAPAHGGLEGQPYRLVVAATSTLAREDASAAVATSALLVDLPGPDFDPQGSRPVEPRTGFLGLPEDARYNFDSAAWQGLEARQFRADVDEAASLVRVVFTNRAGRRWTVLADPDHARAGFRLPRPPATFEDRTYFGDVQGSRARMLVEALMVGGPAARDRLGPERLASAGGPGMERLADLTLGTAALDVGRPEVAWLFPELEGQRLVRGSAVRVRVTGFRVGSGEASEGQVRLTLRGGLGCEGTVLLEAEDVSQGRGEVELRLPATCSGMGVMLVAELADSGGVPLRPPVAAVRGVDIP